MMDENKKEITVATDKYSKRAMKSRNLANYNVT